MKLIEPSDASNDFTIRGGGASFAVKQREMFEQLSEAAKKLNKDKSSTSLSQTDMRVLCSERRRSVRSPVTMDRDETSKYCGQESIFKSPEIQLIRRRVPDHRRNPRKWIKYSLEDVPNEDMSDRSNTQAAFSFLRELRARRENAGKTRVANPGENDQLVKFVARVPYHTPVRSDIVIVNREDKPEFSNGKVILPEYVVGQKREKKLKTGRQLGKIDTSKQLKLDHLQEFDE